MTARGRQYHDPFVQTNNVQEQYPEYEQMKIRGMVAETAGTYVSLEDTIAAIRAFAFAAINSEIQQAAYEVAAWLEGTQPTSIHTDIKEKNWEQRIDQGFEEIERIELYQTELDMQWHARTIDPNGNIINVVYDSFQLPDVEKFINNNYPGIIMFQLQDEREDSTWDRLGPSPRYWMGND